VLVTLDRDFGEVLRYPPETTPGIAILACQGRLSPSSIRARLKELATLLEVHPIDGRLWIVEPGRLRIHGRRDPNFSPRFLNRPTRWIPASRRQFCKKTQSQYRCPNNMTVSR
jgi:hypothetical protein